MKQFGWLVLVLGVVSNAFAGTTAPEIDGNSAVAAIALVSGGLMVIRSRRRK